METVTNHQDLVVWADKSVIAEAKSVFSHFEASFRSIPAKAKTKDLPTSKVSIFYLKDSEPEDSFESILSCFKNAKSGFVLFYTPNHSSSLAFRLGRIVGKHSLERADWAFNLQHVRQLLRAKNVLVHQPPKSTADFDLVAARKRLGLTQEQMAVALHVAARTVQNWEKGIGTSQMAKKTQDLRELLGLMDDNVIAPKEREWLQTPLAAFQNRMPSELIAEGKLRDLIVEFLRLSDGQPL
jgi:DNA-binding transcriptional regulator YiaG